MNLRPGISLVALIVLCLTNTGVRAEDASIERLLKKLPPPEKVARPPARQGLDESDPVLSGPLGKQAIAAIHAEKFSRALGISREMSQRYPRSAIAHGLHGSLALNLRRFPEASIAFQNAITLEPKFSVAHFGLGASEAEQGHFAPALQHFQHFAHLEPKVEIAWLASSECAERLGRLKEGREYASRATSVAPGSAAAWLQLARTEAALGHTGAARQALARAQKLGVVKKNAAKR